MFRKPFYEIESALKLIFLVLLGFYRVLLRSWLGSCCRYEPSCSIYAGQALQYYPFFKGIRLIIRRLLSCHPFCLGGYDPLPDVKGRVKISAIEHQQ